jgi:hypothetical protein
MAAVPVATVLAEAGLAAALAPLMPLIGGTAVLGIVSWKLVAWWKASTAAAAVAAAAAKAAAEAAVAEVVGVAVTLSTPVLLVGGVVVLAVIGGVYYQVSKLKRWLCAKYLHLLSSTLGIRKRSVIRPQKLHLNPLRVRVVKIQTTIMRKRSSYLRRRWRSYSKNMARRYGRS